MTGTWDFSTATPLERPEAFKGRPVLSDEEARDFLRTLPNDGCRVIKCDGSADGRLSSAYDEAWWGWGHTLAENRTSLIVDPPDGRIPSLTAGAKQRFAERRADGKDDPEQFSSVDRCLVGFNAGPPLNPSAYNNFVQVVQTASHMVLHTEMIHDARIVPIGPSRLASSGLARWYGESRASWQGDTLIVETTNFRAESNSRSSKPEAFRLVERFKLTDADTLVYEYTMDDPNTWTTPWTVRIPMKKTNELIFEYACHEGNHSLPDMMLGARDEDRRARPLR